MPRRARSMQGGYVYHVLNRSNARQAFPEGRGPRRIRAHPGRGVPACTAAHPRVLRKPSHATEARRKAYAARLQFGRRSAAPRCAVVLQPPELPLPRRTGSRRGLMNSLPFGGRPRESSSSREWARLATKLDRPETKGYAVGFAGLIDLIFSRSEERPRLATGPSRVWTSRTGPCKAPEAQVSFRLLDLW